MLSIWHCVFHIHNFCIFLQWRALQCVPLLRRCLPYRDPAGAACRICSGRKTTLSLSCIGFPCMLISASSPAMRWNFLRLNTTFGFGMFWFKSRTLKETIKMMLCSSLTQGGLQTKYAVQIAFEKSPQLTAWILDLNLVQGLMSIFESLEDSNEWTRFLSKLLWQNVMSGPRDSFGFTDCNFIEASFTDPTHILHQSMQTRSMVRFKELEVFSWPCHSHNTTIHPVTCIRRSIRCLCYQPIGFRSSIRKQITESKSVQIMFRMAEWYMNRNGTPTFVTKIKYHDNIIHYFTERDCCNCLESWKLK